DRGPNGKPIVPKVVLRAIPVTMPGNAIGRITANEIVSRPKNWFRATAIDASVPRARAMAVAPSATPMEVTNAARRPVFSNASTTHWVVKPVGGQADVPLALNA